MNEFERMLMTGPRRGQTSDRRPILFINHAPEFDWLIALEFGRVDDGQPPENWRGVSESFGYLHERPGGRTLGFKVLDFSGFDPEDTEVEEIWSGPRFDAPQLGLVDVVAGEIVIAARAYFGELPSMNRIHFQIAVEADTNGNKEEAERHWRWCLEAGDPMAHFGLGYTLYDLGRYHEAYCHLRYYTEVSPHDSWNWCWFGKAAEAFGQITEARDAYQQAIDLAGNGSHETDAPELLEQLDRPEGESRR